MDTKALTFQYFNHEKYFEKSRTGSLNFYAVGVIGARNTSLWSCDESRLPAVLFVNKSFEIFQCLLLGFVSDA